jgi:hypothetical protein
MEFVTITDNDLARPPEGHIFAGDYGENYHLVEIGKINLITGLIIPICGGKPIRIEKKANRILPHRVCEECRKKL